jgi:hypothetical protein
LGPLMAAALGLCHLHPGMDIFVFGHHGRAPFRKRAADTMERKLRVVYAAPLHPRHPRYSARRVALTDSGFTSSRMGRTHPVAVGCEEGGYLNRV